MTQELRPARARRTNPAAPSTTSELRAIADRLERLEGRVEEVAELLWATLDRVAGALERIEQSNATTAKPTKTVKKTAAPVTARTRTRRRAASDG